MKYVCLCYEEEKKFEEMPKNDWDEVVRETYAYNEEFSEKGERYEISLSGL